MRYRDPLYDEWELPNYLERLIKTKEMVRLRNIAQSVLPNDLMPYGPIPSRFQHGLGVARLAMTVMENNPCLKPYLILPVSALLHDAGNSALSHLGEHFLKELTGHDGESFLITMLDGSETEKILKELGLSVEEVTYFVTGNSKPFSDILNGSMDIDNLDNVGRYNLAASLDAEKFDAIKIASSFRFDFNRSRWAILDREGCWEETQKWKTARAVVYGSIYSRLHLSVAMMIHRAVEIAFCESELSLDFFRLNDVEAINYLATRCNLRTKRLVDRARRWDWYDEVVSIETTDPSERFKMLASNWRGRKLVADVICRDYGREPDEVCVLVGRGRDKRKISVPFVSDAGVERFDSGDDSQIYRLKVWVPKEAPLNMYEVRETVEEMIR